MTKRIRNRRFLFEQQLKPVFWDWTVSDKKLLENWEENKDKICRLVEKERVETPKSRGGRHLTRINALAYLIHAKDKDKYQYPVSDVETFDTLDYEAFINQNKEDFENYSATRKREKSEESLDLVLAKVQLGELTYNDVMEDDNLAFLFGNNQQKFRERFNFYGERQAFLRLKSLELGEYQLYTRRIRSWEVDFI